MTYFLVAALEALAFLTFAFLAFDFLAASTFDALFLAGGASAASSPPPQAPMVRASKPAIAIFMYMSCPLYTG